MIKIRVLAIGKAKGGWVDDALRDYIDRLRGKVEIEWVWARDDDALIALVPDDAIALDAQGKLLDSEGFAGLIEGEGARMTIVIGGAEGLPQELKRKLKLVSLSRMTFPHQVVRIILAEQIYRATEIWKGSRYHK